ncbi:hypothetical protein C8A00DRAFT_12167 [Chaetomidium leptoderma]|uniref:Pt repeat family protein n=1 Tax=Chaetomidium leptoderma TaxID=669021 RepID=A0AAN7A0H1_9PEZI|nr:hypothetical protein C8A00DRAFT_12167 [Chaetomidium leptoderma]
MAWWDSQHRALSPSSPRSRPRLTMGDAFPRLEPTHVDKHIEMERERALLSPVFEEYLGPPTTPALVVHVDIRFTDPIIRSRYCRSYSSSPGLDATNRICRGLVRRIERCSEEFITRKDSGALEVFKGDTYERKPQRFEMTFRVMRRGKGEWAERTYRSYQKQPLTVALTKEVTLAVHRMIGLFLRRHDENFQWLDCPVPDGEWEGSETIAPSLGAPLSLLCIPASRFIEPTQAFEFVPGYSIDLGFRSRDSQRKNPMVERRIKVNSAQTTPLTLFMSEDMLWKALQFANQGLDSKKREFDDHLPEHSVLDGPHSEDDTLEIDLRVSNNLGPVYSHMHRNVKSTLALFRDPEAKDCDNFLCDIERYLTHIRDETDAMLNAMNDLEVRVVELKGVGWTLREPAKFTLGSSSSYGRRTIQAALDRMQTGIGDVIRGHNIAIHVTAHKRGHIVLDKAIVAHEKRGKSKETFASPKDAQVAFVTRLKARIQMDIDKVVEDSCSIHDILEDEEDYFARPMTPAQPVTPAQPEQPVFEGPAPILSPSSTRSSPAKQTRPGSSSMHVSPRPRTQRVFSLSRRSTESVRSIDYLRAARDPLLNDSTAASEQVPEPRAVELSLGDGPEQLLAAAEVRPARSFSLVSRRPSSAMRVSNASTLVEEQAVCDGESDGQNHNKTGDAQLRFVEGRGLGVMTSTEEEASPGAALPGTLPGAATPTASLASNPADQQLEVPSGNDESRDAPPSARENKQGKMDTPEAFVDAREYVASPVSEGIAKSECFDALAGVRSPRDDDEFSTAPSTPELSTGGSSPRHSVLITPVYLRTGSRAKDPVPPGFYPESDPEDATTDVQGESTPGPDSKEDHGRPATDECTIGQPNSLPQPVAGVSAAVEGPENTPGDANNQHTTENCDPAARVVSLDETPDTKSTSTPRPCTTPLPIPGSSTNSSAASGSQVYTTNLGAELAAGSDSLFHAPDFPTPQVRGPDSSAEPVCNPVLHSSKSGLVLNPVNKLEFALEPEPHISEAPGSDLGAGRGSEATPVEDSVNSHAPDDVAEALTGDGPEESCGAEPEAVPSGAGVVVAEVMIHGTEDASEVGSCPLGSDNTADGTGLVTDDHEKEQLTIEETTSQDVGPVEETVEVHGSDDINAHSSETPELLSEEDRGPSSGPETAHIEPEDAISDKVSDSVSADHAANETAANDNADVSDPGAVPEHAEHRGADPEPPVASQVPVPTATGAEQDGDSQPEDAAAVSDGPEFLVESPGLDDAGAVSQDIVPGAQTDPLDEALLNEVETKEQPGAVPTEAETESPGSDDGKGEEESLAVPIVTDVAESESSEQDSREGSLTVPTGPDGTDTENLERDIGDEGKEVAAAAPIVTDAAGTENLERNTNDATEDSITVPTVSDTTDTENPERNLGEEQPVEADDLSQGSMEDSAGEETKSPEARIVDEELAQELDQTDAIGGEEAYESDKEAEPHAVAGVRNDNDAANKIFGPEASIDETGEPAGNESDKLQIKQDVCPNQGTLEPQPHGKHAAPAISVDGLTTPEPDTSTPSTKTTKPDASSGIVVFPIEPPAGEPTQPPPPQPEKAKPHLAPIPDLSKLPKRFSAATRTSLCSDTASFTGRDSVDSIRPSTDEHRRCPDVPLISEQPHTSSSRPQTAGYLGFGDRRESRFVEVGLRGALGDVKARRMSLPLQSMLDKETMDGGLAAAAAAAVGRPSVSPSEKEAGGGGGGGKGSGGSRLGKRRAKVAATTGELDNGYSDTSVLPRMMMMLAGAVAIGKIIRRAAE